MLRLMRSDWDYFLDTLTHSLLESVGDADPLDTAAMLLHSSVGLQMMEAFISCSKSIDVSEKLSEVRARTLVLHRRQLHIGPTEEIAKRLASRIPGARLAFLSGTSPAPHVGFTEAVVAEIDSFLNESIEPPQAVDFDERHRQIELAETLSQRQQEVLRLLATGLPNDAIAEELVIGTGTVKSQIHSIFGKLGVKSRTQVSLKATELDLL